MTELLVIGDEREQGTTTTNDARMVWCYVMME
jgi:hypothetical protein